MGHFFASLKSFSEITTLLPGIVVIAIDQYFKYKIRQNGGFYICNEGISFGISFFHINFVLILSLFLIIGAVFYIKKYTNDKPLFYIFLACFSIFLGGALSNILDRVFWGCVIDYLNPFGKIFPFFNVADIAISTSCILIFYLLYKKESTLVNKL